MMRHKAIIYIGLFVGIMTIACNEEPFFIPEIDGREMKLISPPDSQVTNLQSQVFWWDTITHATSYRLQVASPNFLHPERLVVDTLVHFDQFAVTLSPDEYAWRVRAENSVSTTAYTTRSILIEQDSAIDLTGQILILTSPLNNDSTNSSLIKFEWNSLENADAYQLQLAQPDFNDDNNVFFDTIVTGLNYTYSFADEGTYGWRVRALNQVAFTATPYATRNVVIDQTAPSAPALSFPVADTTINKNLASLQWSRDAAVDFDSVFLYSDSLITLVHSTQVSTASYSASNFVSSGGTYFWRVKSYDPAGNASSYSNVEKFRVQ